MQLQGVFTALITPFRNGEVDWKALHDLVEFQVQGGVAGIAPVGTTGESPTLSCAEHLRVIEEVVTQVNHRCLVIAGTGANSTAEAITLTRDAKKAGADLTLQVTPYYNKPTQEGLYRHFATVADEAGLPIVLYNVPGRSGVPIAEATVARLAAHPLIAAIKEAAGSVERVSAIKALCDITVLSGDDSLALPMISVGASGVISVTSNLLPREMTEFIDAALAGDVKKAQAMHHKLYPFFRDQFIETNPIPIKAALAMTGHCAEEYRLPLCEMSAEHREKLRATLQKIGVLP